MGVWDGGWENRARGGGPEPNRAAPAREVLKGRRRSGMNCSPVHMPMGKVGLGTSNNTRFSRFTRWKRIEDVPDGVWFRAMEAAG